MSSLNNTPTPDEIREEIALVKLSIKLEEDYEKRELLKEELKDLKKAIEGEV